MGDNTLPLGYRYLNEGEIIEKGDLYFHIKYFNGNKGDWQELDNLHCGRKFTKRYYYPIIRKIQEKINYTNENKLEVLNILKDKRAHNEDSAYKAKEEKEFSLYYSLAQDDIIKQVKDKFYLN